MRELAVFAGCMLVVCMKCASASLDNEDQGYGPSETGNILLETETEAPDSGYESQDSQDSGYDSQNSVYYLAGQHSYDSSNTGYGRQDPGFNELNTELYKDPSIRAFNDTAHAQETIKNKTEAQQKEQLEKLEGLVKDQLKKLAKKVVEKVKPKLQIKLLKVTSRILAKIAKKTGIRMLARLGVKAGEKAAIKAAQMAAAKVGQVLTQAAAASSLGPAAPFVEAALLVFDILSISLDSADAGGYMKMGTIEEYTKIRDEVNNELRKSIEAEGGDFPSVVGPFDKLSDSEYDSIVNDTVSEILNPTNGNPVLANILQKLRADVSSNQLTEADINEGTKTELYANLVDSDEIFDLVCTSLNGKVVDADNAGRQCSYKDRQSCESSYSWPLNEDSNEIYAEYKTEIYGGACVTASYALRGICQGNHLPYDTEIGICKIDEKYCLMKGADWGYNEDIKQNDCVINKGQEFAESLFGTTIVRGFKQIFDPGQYEKCHANETDDVYFCRIVYCNPGDEQWANAGICYPKCKEGFHPFGCCVCSPNCPEGWTDDGATCRRAGYCEEGKQHHGALCYDQCKEGYEGNGPVCWKTCPEGYGDVGALCSKGGEVFPKKSRPADKKACPKGMRDDGTSCWKDTYGRGAGRIPDKKPCPSGMRDDGTSCWRDTYGRGAGRMPDKMPCPSGLRDDGTSCWSDAHIYGKGCCCTRWGCCGNCKSGYHDDGCTCRKTDVGIKLNLFQRQRCKSNEDKCGALCYPKCKSGYHNVGCNLCAPNEGAGIKVTLGQRYTCKSNEELNGALCYPKCSDGYHPKGCCLCEPEGGPGIRMTLFERQYCRGNEKNVVGICWSPCPQGQKDDGALCRIPLHSIPQESYGRGVGTPDTVIKGKAASYGRGVGKPAVHIRAKKRIIPFSTKNNK